MVGYDEVQQLSRYCQGNELGTQKVGLSLSFNLKNEPDWTVGYTFRQWGLNILRSWPMPLTNLTVTFSL